MADLLGGGAEGVEVPPVELDARVQLGEERAHPGSSTTPSDTHVAVLGDEGPAAAAGIAGGVLAPEIRKSVTGASGVSAYSDSRRRCTSTSSAGDAHCGRPSPGSTGAIPRSASRTAARRLPVCTQRS